jgi:uncharacterized protein
MGQPLVHFEIIGQDPARLRQFYADLFGWELDVGDTVTDTVSQPGQYGFLDASKIDGALPANGGVGGGPGHRPHTIFYVGVPDVEEALKQAEALGATRTLGPEGVPGQLVVGQFTDPEGNLIGVAGTR